MVLSQSLPFQSVPDNLTSIPRRRDRSAAAITNRKPIPGQAVVLGASIAGLLTARELAERFSNVVIIERDRLDRKSTRLNSSH